MKRPRQPKVRLTGNEISSIKLSMSQERYVGRVVSAWSDLEQVVEMLIWDLFQVDMEHGKIITKRLSTDARLQMLRALVRLHYFDEDLRAIETALDKVNDLKEDRNFIAHGTWFRHADGNALASSTRPKSDPFTVVVEAFSPRRFRVVSEQIRQVTGDLGRFSLAMHDAIQKP